MTALLTAPDGTIVAEEVFVEIVGLQLQVDMPALVRTGETTSFQVMVPDTFTPPFTLSFSRKPGLTFDYAVGLPGVLEGTIKVAPSVATGREKFVMEVKDQAGRTASATVEVLIEPGRILAAPLPGSGPSRQQGSGGGGGVGSSPSPF
jgi:hypothetical protein